VPPIGWRPPSSAVDKQPRYGTGLGSDRKETIPLRGPLASMQPLVALARIRVRLGDDRLSLATWWEGVLYCRRTVYVGPTRS
jgi:hypothetical protein